MKFLRPLESAHIADCFTSGTFPKAIQVAFWEPRVPTVCGYFRLILELSWVNPPTIIVSHRLSSALC